MINIIRTLLAKLDIKDFAGFRSLVFQFIKFGMVGIINTSVSLAFYYLFIWFDPALYQIGNVVGWILAILNSYFWNRRLVFKASTNRPFVMLGKTYLMYGTSFLINVVLLHIQVEWIGISTAIAPLLCLIVIVPINFLVSKLWTFRSEKKQEPKSKEIDSDFMDP